MSSQTVDRARSRSAAERLGDALTGVNAIAYCLVLPAILLRLAFTLVPALQTFWLSFTDKSLMAPGRFIGLANYVAMLSDKTLIGSFGFTLFYTVTSVALETALGLAIAMLLMRQLRARWISNFIMLLPWVMAPLLAATVWKIMFYEDGGILNQILRDLGLISSPIRWLSSANTARGSVVLVTVWKNVSWVALIFMAALAALPKDVYEAAEVDGANAWQRFRAITVPMLRPTIFLVLMFRGMGEVQTFEQIGGLTRGGPGTATQNLAYYAYQRFFQELRYGYGSAINVLLLLLTALIGGFFAWRMYKASSR
ncbi:sugar ABC transporter permease [Mesorhizobium sp. BR1-1-16]|uniref:carbohydrate ABC transporter permease n=1 Tax=Mesorhizobium sp. BR1-1-16 TaxID=2876653 RepID=UPI001CCD3D82|nr:sugar ABC transporter permease [Mesorhizobium sp. BR1-1-16]MBZ9938953.1 sugar ABC transporter permease [Mesorhizobium sp. BR1-1-16]